MCMFYYFLQSKLFQITSTNTYFFVYFQYRWTAWLFSRHTVFRALKKHAFQINSEQIVRVLEPVNLNLRGGFNIL